MTDTYDSAGVRLQKTITKIYEAFVPFSQRAKPLPKVRQPELHLPLLDDLRQEANQAVAELRRRDLVGRPDQGRKVEDLISLDIRELFFDELGQYLAAGAMARAAHPKDCPVPGCDDRYEWNETEFSRTFVGLKDPLTEYIKQVGEFVGGKKT